MCGIVGQASKLPIESREWLIKGRDAIAHRGPDDAGLWWSGDKRVGLGHRRLAIVDVSPSGHQPMHDRFCHCTIVFNGEIYNHHQLRNELNDLGHVFSSKSDTEVILAAYLEWGYDSLQKLDGMFAFALFDQRSRRLFLARDRVGEKPLYYACQDGELIFASELKALFHAPNFSKQINPQALDLYLSMGYVSGSNCILNGVSKLPPAHYALFDLDNGCLNLSTYWQLPQVHVTDDVSYDDNRLLNQLESLLESSVQHQLVADVPVGVLLSGGVDSSLITAMAARCSSKVKTFNVGFPGHALYDEAPHARLIAQHFNTEHIELNAASIGPELLPMLARQFDEPMVDSSMLPTYLVSSLVRKHCTVALGGDGGDELFGGYSHYSRILKSARYTKYVPGIVGKLIAKSTTYMIPQGVRGRNWLRSLSCNLESGLPLVATLFDSPSRIRLLGANATSVIGTFSEEFWINRIPYSENLLDRTTRMDFLNYLPEDILVKIDRASMLNSLELRAPFLDRAIIEFAFSRVPPRLKATPNERKILLKRLAQKLLPPEFDKQRKQGFSIPLSQWLKSGAWRDFFLDTLLDKQCIFDRRFILGLIKGQDKGLNNTERLFGLVMFELWRREYNVSF